MKYQCGHIIALSAILSFNGAAFAQAASSASQPAINPTISTTDSQSARHKKRHSKSRSKTKRGKAMTQSDSTLKPNSTLKQEEESTPPAARTPAREVHDPADYPPGKKPPEPTYKPPIDNP